MFFALLCIQRVIKNIMEDGLFVLVLSCSCGEILIVLCVFGGGSSCVL